MKGISILALDATGGGGNQNQAPRSARIEGVHDAAGVLPEGSMSGERGLEQKSGNSSAGGAVAASAGGGAGWGAGRGGVIDVDLSG